MEMTVSLIVRHWKSNFISKNYNNRVPFFGYGEGLMS